MRAIAPGVKAMTEPEEPCWYPSESCRRQPDIDQLKLEILNLKDQLATVRELREYDRQEIHRLRMR